MAKLIDNNGVQHYATQMLKAENKKVGNKSLPQALIDIDNKLDEMQELFEQEYGSELEMKIENTINSNNFKVGVGDSIDKSSDVMNSFSEVEIEGNSLVNLIDTSFPDKLNITPTGNELYTFSDGVLENQTGKDSNKWESIAVNTFNIKNNTKYTVLFTALDNDMVFQFSTTGNANTIYCNKNTQYKKVFQTNSNSRDYGFRFKIYASVSGKTSLRVKNLMLLEGDWTNKPIPQYFERIKSTGDLQEDGLYKVDVLSKNKNLYDLQKTDKKQILLQEPLRALPNGIKDSIEKINDEWKIVRRCAEIVLDNTYNYLVAPSYINGNPRFKIMIDNIKNLKDINYSRNNIACDKIPLAYIDNNFSGDFGIYQHNDSKGICIYLKESELETNDVEGFKKWINKLKPTVIYELEKYIYEDLPDNTIQVWKDGHISIDTIIPPSKTTHTIALSKPTQIKNNIEELSKLRDRVASLEALYDQIALEQARDLALLTNDYENDFMED